MSFLTSYRTDAFGDYEEAYQGLYGAKVAEVFGDEHPEVLDIMEKFRSKLAEIEKTIKERNETRLMPYEAMIPSLVLNSASM